LKASRPPLRASPKKWRLTRSRRPLLTFTADHQKCGQPQKRKPSGITGGFSADFFGASSVASALGFRSGATPHECLQPNIHSSALPHKEDISIWQKSGHFYLALTWVGDMAIKGNME
jgi:hypothetical protein